MKKFVFITAFLATSGILASNAALSEVDSMGYVTNDNLLDTVGQRSVCATLVNSESGASTFKFAIDVQVRGGAATILPAGQGSISGALCDTANWVIDGGVFTKTSMTLNATYQGTASCARNLDVDGQRNPPPKFKWTGDYCFDGSTCYPHNTVVSASGC